MIEVYSNKALSEFIPDALQRGLYLANESVIQQAAEQDSYDNTGTTLIAAVIKDEKLYYISIGDSRIYLYADNQLETVNIEHNYANQLMTKAIKNEISLETAENDPQRTHLTSFLGMDEIAEIDYNKVALPFEPGKIMLLCSDGLYNTLDDTEIK